MFGETGKFFLGFDEDSNSVRVVSRPDFEERVLGQDVLAPIMIAPLGCGVKLKAVFDVGEQMRQLVVI